MNKDQDMQYGVGVEIAQTNRPELQQILQESMNREPQPMLEIILEELTIGWPPSGGDAIRKHARLHQSLELCYPRARRHPLFVTTSSGTCLLWAHLLWVHSSPLQCHLSDLDGD